MKHIAFVSFGKDSLAQLIEIKRLGLPLDEAVYCDIRYTPETSGELPVMAEWIPTAEKILADTFGIRVRHITAEQTFKDWFYRQKAKGNHIGEIYGFPFIIGAWCNSRLKLDVIDKYINSLHDDITEYVGIAYDEPTRYERLANKSTPHHIRRSILYEQKITEAAAFEICKPYGLVSPLYDNCERGGCWFCVKQSIHDIYNLWRNYPDLFAELKKIEKDSRCLMLKRHSLAEYETRFASGYIPPVRNSKRTRQTSIFDILEDNA